MHTPNIAYNPSLARSIATVPSNNKNVAKIAIAAIAGLIALILGLLTLMMIGALNTGLAGLLVGMLFAFVPVPVYLLLTTWFDRYEPEPLWMLAATFIWGATVAVFFSFILNTIAGIIVGSAYGGEAGQLFSTSVSAPIVEESAKGLALLVVFFWRRNEFDGVMDGIIYASMVGLGFAMTENVSYYGAQLQTGLGIFGSMILFTLRGVFLPFAHPLFTSMTGIGLGIAAESRNTMVKFVAPVFGFGMAIFLHMCNNTIGRIFERMGFHWTLGLLAVIVMMVFLFLCLLVVIIFALKREGRIVREQLQRDLHTGMLTLQEIECLCSVRKRMGKSFGAFSKGGFSAWNARKRFNHLASELAFHRSRVMRGIIPNDPQSAAQEALLVQQLCDLRMQLGAH